MEQMIVIQSKKHKNRGVSLVEVMIALVVLLIVFMGLIQASLVSIQSNVKNELRDDAVRITSDRMARLRVISLDDPLLADTGDAITFVADLPATVTRNVRNAPVVFTIDKIVDTLDANHKQISLRTTWPWQGENFTHTIAATRGR